MIDNLFIQNSSILAIQLSVLSGLFFWLFLRIGSKWRYIYVALAFSTIICEIVLEGRAAVLGSLLAFLFCIYSSKASNSKFRRVFSLISILLFFILTIFTSILFKTESSKGRIFIWKQSIALFERNWTLGVGLGRINPAVNHQQAEYFSKESLYTTSAVNADDCYFAFNEWLHIGVELGILGLLLSLIITFFLLSQCFKNANTKNAWKGAILLPIFFASLFSYPLHNIYILCCFIIVSGVIAVRYISEKRSIPQRAILFLAVIIFSLFLYSGVKYLRFKRQVSELNILLKEGRRTEAYQLGINLEEYGKKSHVFSSLYLELLFDTHRLKESIKWFEKCHAYHCNNKAHTVIAKCYSELGDSANAEKHFLISLYIKPHLLQSRVDLMNFYSSHGNKKTAIYWASEVLKYPIKVKNIKAEVLRNEARRFLQSGYK